MIRWDKQQAAGWAKINKGDTIWKRAGSRLSQTQGRSQDGRIREVLQGIAPQVCIKCAYVQCHKYKRLGINVLLAKICYSYFIILLFRVSCLIIYFSAG